MSVTSDTPGKKRTSRSVLVPRSKGERFSGLLGACIVSVAAGQLYMLAFPPYEMWFLLPVAIGLILYSSYTRHWSGALLTGTLAGTSAFLPLFSWANIYAGTGPWVALAVFQALYIAAFSISSRLIFVRHGISVSSSLGVSFLWAAIELARSTVPWGGLPWGVSAFAYSTSPLLNFGPWIGTVGLSVITGFLATHVFSGVMSVLWRRKRGRNGLTAVWPSAVIVAVILVAFIVPRPHAEFPTDRQRLSVAAVQGNVKPPPPGSYYLPKEMFANHVAATGEYLRDKDEASLVVWPEDSTGWDLPSSPERMSVVQKLSRNAGAPIMVGSQVPHGANERLNKAILIDETGATGHEYAKQHPVPFGEYIPARSVFSKLSDKTDLVSMDMAPGTAPGVLPVHDASVGTLICFEIAYEGIVRDTVNAGADVLVVQSNNALFGDSHEAVQQLAQARVFSVISGRSVVHVSTVGHSAIFTPDGRTLDSLNHWTRGTMKADVPLRTTLTPAMKYGPAIAAATVAIAIMYVLRALLTRPRYEKIRR